MYADVAVCLPLSRTFVYRVDEPIETGCRVLVPFRKREVEGFVVALREDRPGVDALLVKSVIDAHPLLRPEIFKLCRWISEYYVSPLGEVLKGALPPGITRKHVERGLTVSGPPPATTSRSNVVAGFSPRPTLTSDQSRALQTIIGAPDFHPILLHGVTGSGKTEIYMRAAEHFLATGKTSLILVPEIGLTPQLM